MLPTEKPRIAKPRTNVRPETVVVSVTGSTSPSSPSGFNPKATPLNQGIPTKHTAKRISQPIPEPKAFTIVGAATMAGRRTNDSFPGFRSVWMSALAATVRLGVFERTSDNGMGRSAASKWRNGLRRGSRFHPSYGTCDRIAVPVDSCEAINGRPSETNKCDRHPNRPECSKQ